MKVAIIAWWKWTRLWFSDIPKPMVKVAWKPILEWQIELAKRYWLKDIIILSWYLSNVITEYFWDWSKFWVNVEHIVEEVPLGTAWAIKQLEWKVNERFFVFYGDTIMDIDLEKMINFDKENLDSLWTLLVHPNNHPYDSDLIELNKDYTIKQFHSKPHPEWEYYHNCVNAALYILSPEVFKHIPSNESSDFWKHIFPDIINDWKILRWYKTHEYIKDMWTPERLKQVEWDILSWKVGRLNMENKQKAIFLDRDGVINKEVDNLHDINDLEILPSVSEWLSIINKSEYLSLVVTNQPVIAKWMITEKELDELHKKMESIIWKDWAYFDDIYYCPHHPDKWYEWEIPELKIECNCRKPKIGMIENAINKYNIDVNKSFIIWDSTRDIQTWKNAWIKTILVKTWYAWDDWKYDVEPDFTFENLYESANFIINKYDSLYSKVWELLKNNPKIITIWWLSRSWKSTLSSMSKIYLSEQNKKYLYINLDNRLISKENRTLNMTVKDRYQYDKVTKDFQNLLKWENIKINKYDIKSRSTVAWWKEIQYNKDSTIIIDWVVALDIPHLNEISNLKIFCEIDETERYERFKNLYKYKWLSNDEIEELFKERQNDEYNYILNSKKNADCILNINQ